MDDEVWDPTVFSKNRYRLLNGDVAQESLLQVVSQAREQGLTLDEHFTVDGTLVKSLGGSEEFPRRTRSRRLRRGVRAIRR